MNTCIFTGSLGKDPEMRYAPSGSAVLRFSIAVDSGFGDHKRTDWVPLVAFGKSAENMSKFCQKGTLIEAACEYQTSKYEKDGNTEYSHNFIVVRWKVLGRGRPKDAVNESEYDGEQSFDGDENEFPF